MSLIQKLVYYFFTTYTFIATYSFYLCKFKMIDLSKRFRDIAFEKKGRDKKENKKKKKRDLTKTICFQFETVDLNSRENIF